jgi:hypothetical protein
MENVEKELDYRDDEELDSVATHAKSSSTERPQ